MIDIYYTVAAKAHIKLLDSADYAKNKIKEKAGHTLIGAGLLTVSSVAFSQGLEGILTTGKTTIESIVTFIMSLAVLIGVGGIFYGVKLIIDKANDRENVKNSHIGLSLVGGAFMLVLGFVVSSLGETTGGEIGAGLAF